MPDKDQTKGAVIKAWAKLNLVGNTYISPIGVIHITMTGIKETINQPHKFKQAKNEAIFSLPSLLKNSKFACSAADIHGKVKEYHYLEIIVQKSKSYIVIKETWEREKHFYSIVDKLKKK